MNKFKEYYKIFCQEEICIQFLKKFKEQQGIICNKCGNKKYYWKNDKKKFECKECAYRISLKKDTVMENSKLPLQYWLSTIAFLSATGEDISALKLQQELGHNRYEPILRMLKKIKNMPETDMMKQKIVEYINSTKTVKI